MRFTNLRILGTTRTWLAPLLCVGALLGASPVMADVSAADKETARALMNEGDRLYAAKDFAGALKAYAGAHAVMNVPTTGIEVAKAQEAAGLLVEARDTYLQVSRMPRKGDEPKPFTKAREKAAAQATLVAARIPSITTTVSGAPDGASVTLLIDGVPIPSAALSLPRKVNPGKHVVAASAPGFAEASAEISVSEAQAAQVKLTLQKAGAPTVAPPPAATPAAPTAPAPAAVSAPPKQSKTLAYSALGVGALGIGVGAVTGLLALSKTADLKDNCPAHQCASKYQADIDSSRSMGTISTVAFAIGAVGTGLGVYLLASGSEKRDGRARNPTPIAPVLGLGAVGVRGEF